MEFLGMGFIPIYLFTGPDLLKPLVEMDLSVQQYVILVSSQIISFVSCIPKVVSSLSLRRGGCGQQKWCWYRG